MNQAELNPAPFAEPTTTVFPMRSPEPSRVLIVDDDRVAAKALAQVLNNAGFTTTVLHTGGDAIRRLEEEQFSAALLDVHLPDLNGLVLAHKIREHIGPAAPIFILSGDTSMETINSLPHVGATYFFAKPLQPGFVIQRLRQSLGKVPKDAHLDGDQDCK